MAKIISIDTLKAERRQGTHEEQVPYIFRGELKTVTKKIVNGEMELLAFDRPVGEMFTTPEGLENILKKVTLDMNFGREQVPLLYGPIYRTLSNPNFPRLVPVAEFSQAQAVFLEHAEGEEIKFGTRKTIKGDGVPIITYTSGFDGWTVEMEKFDETWRLDQFSAALGEAHNALLNHIHLNPILSYAYQAKNKTAPSAVGGTYLEKLRNTLRDALKHAGQDINPITNARRRPTILLSASVNQVDLQDALGRMVIGGTEYAPLGQIQTMIFYDGWSVTVGDKTYTYPGVPADKVYLIDPGRYFLELIKQDLIVDSGEADTSRLLRAQMVAYLMRGVWASPADAVEEVTLPVA